MRPTVRSIKHGYSISYGGQLSCLVYGDLGSVAPEIRPLAVPIVQMALEEYERLILALAEEAERRISWRQTLDETIERARKRQAAARTLDMSSFELDKMTG